jgi:hypothetical protein
VMAAGFGNPPYLRPPSHALMSAFKERGCKILSPAGVALVKKRYGAVQGWKRARWTSVDML